MHGYTALSMLGIAIANNLDNTAVGLGLGIGRVRLPVIANLWISVITFAITGAAAIAGARISSSVGSLAAHVCSAAVLCAIGAWMLAPAEWRSRIADILRRRDKRGSAAAVAEVLDDPRTADRDQSHHLDLREASVLGVALSINNIGGGVAAGLAGQAVLWVAALSAIVSFVVLGTGTNAAEMAASRWLGKHGARIAGAILIAVGIAQLR